VIAAKGLPRRFPLACRRTHGVEDPVGEVNKPDAQRQYKWFAAIEMQTEVSRQQNLPKHRNQRRIET